MVDVVLRKELLKTFNPWFTKIRIRNTTSYQAIQLAMKHGKGVEVTIEQIYKELCKMEQEGYEIDIYWLADKFQIIKVPEKETQISLF